jgi:acyl-CoA oxidase
MLIATNYALSRVQFGPPKQPEIALMDYPSHQQRLIPIIGKHWIWAGGPFIK